MTNTNERTIPTVQVTVAKSCILAQNLNWQEILEISSIPASMKWIRSLVQIIAKSELTRFCVLYPTRLQCNQKLKKQTIEKKRCNIGKLSLFTTLSVQLPNFTINLVHPRSGWTVEVLKSLSLQNLIHAKPWITLIEPPYINSVVDPFINIGQAVIQWVQYWCIRN